MEFVQYISMRASKTTNYHFRLLKGNHLWFNGTIKYTDFIFELTENQDFIRFNLGNK